jgi:hypothetical protein
VQLIVSQRTVKTASTLRRWRLLPADGDVLVAKGDEVKPTQAIAQTEATGDHWVVPVGRLLNLGRDQFEQSLQVEAGARVHHGQVLARKERRFGRAKIVSSPINGTVLEVFRGYLVLQETVEPFQLRAMMQARVTAVMPQRGALLEAVGTVVQPFWTNGMEGFGKIRLMTSDTAAETGATIGDVKVRGAVLVTNYVDQVDVLDQLGQAGAKGLIAGSLTPEVCRAACRVTFPVVITDSIGRISMAEPILGVFRQLEGRDAALFPSSSYFREQVAQIVIPLPLSRVPEQESRNWRPLEEGKTAWIHHGSGDSSAGKIVRVHRRPRHFARVFAAGADVKLADGQTIAVPLMNLELMLD